MFNEGISVTGDLIDLATEAEIVQKSGAWFSYNEVRLGQGRENSKQFMKDNPELLEEIRRAVIAAKVPPRVTIPVGNEEVEETEAEIEA
jgi:recombination protein RecA